MDIPEFKDDWKARLEIKDFVVPLCWANLCSAIQSNGLGSAEVDLFEQGVFLSSEVLYDIEAYVKNSGNPVFIL